MGAKGLEPDWWKHSPALRRMMGRIRAEDDRAAAKRFLARAARLGGPAAKGEIKAALWRVVVAASHRSGRFEG